MIAIKAQANEQHLKCFPLNDNKCIVIFINTSEDKYELDNQSSIQAKGLNFINSTISRLPDNLMTIMTNLEDLKANKCELKHIDPKIFGSVDTSQNRKDILLEMKRLNFSNNEIKTIENYSFSRCHKLEYLDLKDNLISSIGNKAFSKAHKLAYLDLTNNKLRTLDKNIFIDPPIEWLALSHNYLTDVSCIQKLPSLIVFDVSFNKGVDLNTAFAGYLGQKLATLYLNGIYSSHSDDLFQLVSKFESLRELNVENNNLDYLNFEKNINNTLPLEVLKYNSFVLPVSVIRKKFPNLQIIHVGDNKLNSCYVELMSQKLKAVDIIVSQKNAYQKNVCNDSCYESPHGLKTHVVYDIVLHIMLVVLLMTLLIWKYKIFEMNKKKWEPPGANTVTTVNETLTEGQNSVDHTPIYRFISYTSPPKF